MGFFGILTARGLFNEMIEPSLHCTPLVWSRHRRRTSDSTVQETDSLLDDHACAHGAGLLFGRDAVFTYGPLAWLVLPMNVGNNLPPALAFQAVSWLDFAAALAWFVFARRIPLWRAALVAACLLAGWRSFLRAVLANLFQASRILHNPAYVLPYLGFKRVGADLDVVANALASEPVRIRARTPIVTEIPQAVSLAPLTSRLTVERISAEGTAGQTLKKMTRSSQAQSSVGTIFPEGHGEAWPLS